MIISNFRLLFSLFAAAMQAGKITGELKFEVPKVKDSSLRNYQPCEVYSRGVGYLRPVVQWNDAKQA
jgi:hypothetical protein